MEFDLKKLGVYRDLIENTELQEGYFEFIRLFRYLRAELMGEFREFSFSSGIVENCMDFIYHPKHFAFEVWVSGYNRAVQKKFFDLLLGVELEYDLCGDPMHENFIFKSRLPSALDMSDGALLGSMVKGKMCEMIRFTKSICQ